MKAKYILSSLLLAGCTFFSSCEDNLDISQHGVSTFENFYKNGCRCGRSHYSLL